MNVMTPFFWGGGRMFMSTSWSVLGPSGDGFGSSAWLGGGGGRDAVAGTK